ncbi:MAG: DNA methyltransferase [Candidatus Hydrogenedentes bacterium]|nr:DNA methyltransferase [Candidatus Hydrogenedentota bacterium]
MLAKHQRSVPNPNKIKREDLRVHEWYRFVLSYPPHLVREYMQEFGAGKSQRVLDPFCGTGTTLVECKRLGIDSIGIEANPMAYFASRVKCDWTVDPDTLLKAAERIAKHALRQFESEQIADAPNGCSYESLGLIRTLEPGQEKLILKNSISPLPLHKSLILRDAVNEQASGAVRDALLLALAKVLVKDIANLRFGPEVGLGTIKRDAAVVKPWREQAQLMAAQLRAVRRLKFASTEVVRADARMASQLLRPGSITAVFTSPPYPNEKDYTRTTRLESVVLGLLSSKEELRAMKELLIRSNTRTVYVGDDDGRFVTHIPEIQALADEIECRRIALGKDSGFERLYHRVTRLYFGGMAQHLEELRAALKPGALLGYVVGDQASFFRVHIPTGDLLGKIASHLSYEVVRRDLFRERFATASKQLLREEVLVLKWPG